MIFFSNFQEFNKVFVILSIYLDADTFSRACFEKVNHLADKEEISSTSTCSLQLTLQAINESLTCCRDMSVSRQRNEGWWGGAIFNFKSHICGLVILKKKIGLIIFFHVFVDKKQNYFFLLKHCIISLL